MHDATSGAKPAGPCSMVIFGAGGDLTKRLIVPSLYNLACSKLLPEQFAITGVDLADLPAEKWRDSLREMTEKFVAGGGGQHEDFSSDAWNWLASRMYYLRGDLNDSASYQKLSDHLRDVDSKHQTGGNYLFYLAVADCFFAPVAEHLGESKLAAQENGQWRRVVIEKPFGHDLPSAKELDARILKVLDESQIYRIDHFLGKETVQNIMLFRFANGFFEPVWSRDRIDHVQITVAETVGVEARGKFYETTGALRDMVPNHLFQLLAMTAMEAPSSFRADAVRSEKAKVIESVRVCPLEDVHCMAVRGQYGPGTVDGNSVPGYRQETDVAPESSVETYVALKLLIENWRWSGVPFYIRTGKRLAKRKSVIAIRFKEAPHALFRGTAVTQPAPNWLVIRVQPEEGISLEFGAKIPGPTLKLGDVWMDFKYHDYFGTAPSTGYETLIYDVMIGDATLFQRADNIEWGWRVVQPVLDKWSSEKPESFPNYAAGSQGPAAADQLLEKDGRQWRPIR
jgi:glucose-6-phosphate 1-dehydrogenase